MRKYLFLLGLSTIIVNFPFQVQSEPVIISGDNSNLSLSIYNQNLALVKDVRQAELRSGLNDVIFDGVAQRIQPETAIIYGNGIKVIEQNYNYNLLSYANFIEQNIGNKVNTVRENPKNGDNIFERAILIGTADGRPVLQFDYGIDTNFSGRVVFDDVPAGMSNKPTLTAKLDVNGGGDKNLRLAYLTDGLSWKTDYVANVNSRDKLNLTGWVTINNESGIDYENAKIQLIAGDVNVVRSAMPRMAKGIMMMRAQSFNSADAVESIEPESISSYELYTLPTTASIANHQTKQIALIEKHDVTYKKEFNLQIPLYFGNNDYNGNGEEFEKLHPAITYVIKNTTDANLGISLPTGIIRFYENDKNNNLQFIGSSHIANTAKEDTLRLNLGDAFNISISGKSKRISTKELSRQPKGKCYDIKEKRTYEIEATVNNAEAENNDIILTQHFSNEYKIIEENIKSSEKNGATRQWIVPVKAQDKTTLIYMVEITSTRGVCN